LAVRDILNSSEKSKVINRASEGLTEEGKERGGRRIGKNRLKEIVLKI
jgi:hypothetical protein